MATTFNKLVGIFRLGKDPEIKYTPAGLAVANFSGASDHSFKKNDEWQKETEWTRMVAFGKTAERIGEQLKKGSLIYVEGRLKTNKWEDKDGNTRYNTDARNRSRHKKNRMGPYSRDHVRFALSSTGIRYFST